MVTKIRVLLAGAEWSGDVLGSCRRAMLSLGADVKSIVTNSVQAARRPPAYWRGLARVAPRLAGVLAMCRMHDARRSGDDAVRRQLERIWLAWRPQVFLALVDGQYPDCGDSIDVPGVHRVAWLLDDPFWFHSKLMGKLGAFDELWTVEQSLRAPLGVATGKPVRCVPLAADPTIHRPLPPDVRARVKAKIVFVGKSYCGLADGAVRAEALKHVIGDLSIWGDTGWRRNGAAFVSSYRGGPVSPTQANYIYNSAEIAINIHHSQLRMGTSLRTFAIAAAGAFQLADWRPGLSELMEPGREIVTFGCGSELAELSQRYAVDQRARQRISASALARVVAEHTYVHRLQHLISTAT